MGNVFDTLLEVAGFSRKRRTPSARARSKVVATAPSAKAKGGQPSGRSDQARRSVAPKRPVAAAPRVAEAMKRTGTVPKSVRPPPPRQERPVGGFKMAVVVAVFVTGGTWLGSQVQGLAAPTRETVSRDLYEVKPKSSNFTF